MSGPFALPEPWPTLVVGAFGLVLGSFLNVCIHRLPLGESVVSPRSRCPRCGREIRWYENVPLLSWLALRGRCAGCRSPISWRYPLVELLSAALLVALWREFGFTAAFAIAGAYSLALLVLFFTDLDHQLLPDRITLPGFVLGMASAWFNPFLGQPAPLGRLWMSLLGAALGAGALWGVGAIYSRLRGVEAMGMGDVKMMAFVGAVSGPLGVLVTLFAGSIAGAIVGVALIPLRGRTIRDVLPFGCFLAPAALFALLWGRQAIAAYWSFVMPGATP